MSQPASLHGLAITFLCSKLLYFSLFGLFVLQAHELVLTIISLSIYLYVNILPWLLRVQPRRWSKVYLLLLIVLISFQIVFRDTAAGSLQSALVEILAV